MESLSPKVFKNMLIWYLRTWFHGEHGGGARLMVGLNDLKGLFQPLFYFMWSQVFNPFWVRWCLAL